MSITAAVIVPYPVSVVESNLWDVTTWSNFLADVEEVRRAAHERYVFTLRAGRHRDDVLVAVRWRARDHRFTWKSFEGPTWSGEVRLTPLNGRRTRINLEVIAHPRTFGGQLAEMIGVGRRDPAADLLLLQERLSHLPRPIRPSRLTAQDGGELAGLTEVATAAAGASHAVAIPAPRASHELLPAGEPLP
jgi:hypothetical protein